MKLFIGTIKDNYDSAAETEWITTIAENRAQAKENILRGLNYHTNNIGRA